MREQERRTNFPENNLRNVFWGVGLSMRYGLKLNELQKRFNLITAQEIKNYILSEIKKYVLERHSVKEIFGRLESLITGAVQAEKMLPISDQGSHESKPSLESLKLTDDIAEREKEIREAVDMHIKGLRDKGIIKKDD